MLHWFLVCLIEIQHLRTLCPAHQSVTTPVFTHRHSIIDYVLYALNQQYFVTTQPTDADWSSIRYAAPGSDI